MRKMLKPSEFLNQVLYGDCLKVMKKLPSKSIDMILCDLPYGVTSRNSWDIPIPLDLLWLEYKRITKANAAIVLTAIQPFASRLIISNLKMFRHDWIWEKNKGGGFLNSNKMPLRRHEHVLVFYQKLPVYNPQKTTNHKPLHFFTKRTDSTNYKQTKLGLKGGGQTDRYPTSILKIPVINNDANDKIHPTQKPVALFEYLIKTYSNEGDLILDNCFGSGTTGVACINQKRNFIGIEKDSHYFDVAKLRIDDNKNKS